MEDGKEFITAPSHAVMDLAGVHQSSMPRRTLIYYCLGYNTLDTNLKEDLRDLYSSEDLPGKDDTENALVVFEDLYQQGVRGEFPVIYRLYKGDDDTPVRDTLYKFPDNTPGASSETLRKTLEVVKENIPSRSYGMLFSSHATGWLPAGAYNNKTVVAKSVGECEQTVGYTTTCYEIDLKDFARAFPYKFDYILFDACLMGGVEVAYELRDVCDYVGFSQAEVAAAGFNYNTLLQHLLSGKDADLVSVCRDYYEQYVDDKDYGATISLVDCRYLDNLASICREIFEDNAAGLSRLKANEVQGFFRANKRYYYDLEDMIVKAGTPASQLEEFRTAMNDVIAYKASTDAFMVRFGGFYITRFCGLSSYMPSVGTAALDEYYRTLAWNKATSLVK